MKPPTPQLPQPPAKCPPPPRRVTAKPLKVMPRVATRLTRATTRSSCCLCESPPVGGLFCEVLLMKDKDVEKDNDGDGYTAKPENKTFHGASFPCFAIA